MAVHGNGRVDVDLHRNLTSPGMFESPEFTAMPDPAGNIVGDNPIASLFFSKHNVDVLQDGIRYMVYKRTHDKTVISRQSEIELRVIMRSIYLQYARHLPYRVVDQVKELNGKVLDFAVPRILTELNTYLNYAVDVSELPVPLEHSKNVSVKGEKVLDMKMF